MAIESIFAIRGATTVECDSREEVYKRSVELYDEIVKANELDRRNIVSIVATATGDIKCGYPVTAIRETRAPDIPFMSAVEPEIDGSLPLCIRLLITVCSERKDIKARHVYLHGAKTLRQDLN